jgi:hypothetical protein
MKMRKYRHYFLVKVSGNQTIRIPVRVREAKATVTLSRTLADIMAGTEGLSVTCANAVCALRLNGSAFSHPAYMVEFTDNRAYVADKLNKRGTPISCVVYAHNQGSFQKQFDKRGKQHMAKMSGVEGEFTLYPPPPAGVRGNGVNRRGSTTAGTSGGTRDRKRSVLGKGAIARARRAGINLDIRGAA